MSKKDYLAGENRDESANDVLEIEEDETAGSESGSSTDSSTPESKEAALSESKEDGKEEQMPDGKEPSSDPSLSDASSESKEGAKEEQKPDGVESSSDSSTPESKEDASSESKKDAKEVQMLKGTEKPSASPSSERKPVSPKKTRERDGKSSYYGKKRRQRKKDRGSFVQNYRVPLIIAGCTLGGILAAYLGITAFFSSHFYVNTVINGKDFSGQTAQTVENYLMDQVSGYELTVIEKDNESDVISGDDISLTYKKNDEIEKALKKQNPLLWPSAFFSKSTEKITIHVEYDEEALNGCINRLKAVQKEQTEPISAMPVYDGTNFVVQAEQYGTALNMDVLKEKIKQHIVDFQDQLSLMEEGCYKKPRFTTAAPEVQNACDLMNQYCKTVVTYPMETDVVVDKGLISGWISVDENMQVEINEEAVRQWVDEFSYANETVGATRTITSPTGKTVEVSGGTYGWAIDEEMETDNLLNNIKAGDVVTRDPEYSAVAVSHSSQDWGNTYVEVDRSAQYMWYIVDGAVAFQANVVTGLPTPDRATPTGVYYILYMQRNATLVGDRNPVTGQPSYRTPVAYWMPFTHMGHGFHDATWQPTFGGNWYQSHGSHGCVNMSLNEAGTLFEMLETNTPVIIHD